MRNLTTAILALGMVSGTAWAQNPDIIQDTRSTLQNVQKKQTIDQNAVLAVSGQQPSKTTAPASTAPNTTTVPRNASTAPAPSPTTAPAAKASQPAKASVVPAKSSTVPAQKAPENEKAKTTAVTVSKPSQPAVAVEDKKTPVEPKKEEKTYSSVGKRDPFISPVVSRSISGSGCSSGKRCLAIDQIALTGVVKSDTGMIAVVVNALNKAYFLRENDPVFNGYVVKITGDSIVFKETIQDRLGKSFTREVVKKITTPAV